MGGTADDVSCRGRALVVALAVAATAACGSSSSPSALSTPLPPAACGNSSVEPGEECDDGNTSNADGCLVSCRRALAWVSSDVHVHGTGCSTQASPADLAERLKAQQLQVAAALVWGEGYAEDGSSFTGRDHPLSSPGFILHYDLEVSHFAAARTGHLLLLGLDSLEFSDDVFGVPQSGVPIVDWARRQPRAVVGMAHGQFWPADGSFPVPPGGCCVPWEVVVHAARERLDFLSMEKSLDDEPGTFLLWKALQNAGYRVALAGGSDWSCIGERLDERTPRTDVILAGGLSYEGWLSAVKAGRATAAWRRGERLAIRVDGRLMGEELLLPAAGEVTVSVESEGTGGPVEVLVNGEAAARVEMEPGAQVRQLRVPLPRSAWIAARSRSAITNPVYALIDGRPIRAPADICYLWRSVEHLEELVTTGRLRLFASEAEGLAAYREAIAALQRRFVESGGQSCR